LTHAAHGVARRAQREDPLTELHEGDEAPQFVKTAHDGTRIDLDERTRAGTVVLYFYPADETPGCIKEACSFRDSHERFLAQGAFVVGVSSDGPESHRAFAAHYGLPFPLLSDEDGALARAYGVTASFAGLMRGRVTFVIGKDRRIQQRFSSLVRMDAHVKTALDASMTIARSS
jgi:peroxiredoxin Q/BCP